jgi:hypothetical protein
MPEEIAVLFALCIGAGTIISLAWMYTNYLKSKQQPRAVESPEMRQQLDDMRERLETVEERLDFAERLLSQQRDPKQIGGR